MTALFQQLQGKHSLNLRPEAKLLLYLSRTDLDATLVEQAQTLLQRHPMDWVYLLELADQHGVIPLLYESFKKIGISAVPECVLNKFQQIVQVNTLRNLFLVGELCRVLDLLKTHNIPVIPFKGPTLATLAYGGIQRRKAGDLDILVHERDFCKSRDLLMAQGYQPIMPPWFLDAAQEKAYLESRNEYTLIHPETQVCIDLHRRLAAGDFFLMPIDFERLWNFNSLQQRLHSVSVAGRTLPALQAEDLLLYLCVHGSKHLWARLTWICDVAELLRSNPTLNWDWVFQQTKLLGCDRILSVGLLLANDLLGAPIPDHVRQRAQVYPRHRLLMSQVQNWLFRETGAPPKGFSFERIHFHIREIEALRGKMQYCYRSLGHYGLAPVRRAITPTFKDRLFVQLPLPLFPLYYLVRPIRLIRDVGLELWQRRPRIQKAYVK